ncbi:MAG TPA: rubrerythrin family protein [Acidobacteriota bacterium]|nr:rubrerythrin family protein [Acidobacteriota bacterium]
MMKFTVVAALAIFSLLVAGTQVFAVPVGVAKTMDNLKAAITGETTASAKYAAYAKKAREEGYENVAKLFEAASKSEAVHAANHRASMDQLGEKMGDVTPKFEVKSTLENLEDAIKGESYEVATMYPEFLKVSSSEKANIATISFNYAYLTEQKHKALYQNALIALKAGKQNTLPQKYYVCLNCGNTYDSEAAARCAICLTPKDRFVTVG